jgi:hypothetical protein
MAICKHRRGVIV